MSSGWKYCLLFSLLVAPGLCLSQAEEEEERNWLVRGYVKELLTTNFSGDSVLFDNLLHNRLNFKWYPNDHVNVHLELRNRLFWGETVKAIPNYGALVDVNNDYADLSVMTGKNSVLFHSMIDRAFVEWYDEDWEIRLGRQRINWGVNLVWNPNDLFNAYSFFDFDYEERPGSDALRVKRYLGVASSIEIASNVSDDVNELVAMAMWKWNAWNYDFQLLGGKAQEDVAIGIGWAGNIKNSGFKGELTYFSPYVTTSTESFLATVAFDHSFESSFYVNASLLYNSSIVANPGIQDGINLFSQERLTAKNLSPFRYSTFLQTSYSFHPLVNGGLSIIYYPNKRDALFLNPSVSVSLKSNLDLNVISQLYFDRFVDDYEAQAKLIFVRMKWSF